MAQALHAANEKDPCRRIPHHYHKDGSVRAKGRMLGGQPHGHWEWFRKDGTRLRSGQFERGVQTGRWTTYDAKGNVYKVMTTTARTPA
jgi:antitoxin component YwqK of YwqJK toxin-antitoxin module